MARFAAVSLSVRQHVWRIICCPREKQNKNIILQKGIDKLQAKLQTMGKSSEMLTPSEEARCCFFCIFVCIGGVPEWLKGTDCKSVG
jgi:hypothetical protein